MPDERANFDEDEEARLEIDFKEAIVENSEIERQVLPRLI